jgi:hypothetical protein
MKIKPVKRYKNSGASYVYFALHCSQLYVKIGKADNILTRLEQIGIAFFCLLGLNAIRVSSPEDAYKLESFLIKKLSQFWIEPNQLKDERLGESGTTEWHSLEVLTHFKALLEQPEQSIPYELIELDLPRVLSRPKWDPEYSEAMLDVERTYRHKPKAKSDDETKGHAIYELLSRIIGLASRYSKHRLSENTFSLELEAKRDKPSAALLAQLIAELQKIGKSPLAGKCFVRNQMCNDSGAYIQFNASLEPKQKHMISSNTDIFIEDSYFQALSLLRSIPSKF